MRLLARTPGSISETLSTWKTPPIHGSDVENRRGRGGIGRSRMALDAPLLGRSTLTYLQDAAASQERAVPTDFNHVLG